MLLLKSTNRALVSSRRRIVSLGQQGQATSEYAVVILTAIAFGLAVLALFTNGIFDGVLHGLIARVLEVATGKIH